ncbi:hypothetical protein J6590_071181 [Homalodisca vitripennis]|nr:hypothetical protein J6590_071181 [Homalodisca vitripennis]
MVQATDTDREVKREHKTALTGSRKSFHTHRSSSRWVSAGVSAPIFPIHISIRAGKSSESGGSVGRRRQVQVGACRDMGRLLMTSRDNIGGPALSWTRLLAITGDPESAYRSHLTSHPHFYHFIILWDFSLISQLIKSKR